MNVCKMALAAVPVAAVFLAGTSFAQFVRKPPGSPEAFVASNEAALKALDASIAGTKGKRPLFASALHLAHDSIISGIPQEVLNAYADGMKEAGVQRVEIYTTPVAWPDKNAADIAKYDALIKHVREIGLKLGFDPTIITPMRGYAEFHPLAIAAYTEMARRYQPEKFSVLHEPAAMDRRLKEQVSPETWAAFATEACAAVKGVSPNTECTVALLPFERAEFDALVKVPAIHSIGFDIYDASAQAMEPINQMVKAARAAGKNVHIAEVGRPAWDGLATIGLSSKGFEEYNVGNPRFMVLDEHYLETMTRYAAAYQFDSIMWFRSTSFFAYSPPGTNMSLISRDYIQAVAKAVRDRKRTEFFDDYRRVVDSYEK